MSLAGTNLDHGGRFNRRVVLETVRRHGAISRAEIARETGLSAQTASNIAEALLGAGLLVERRRREKRRGQPPVDLAIDPEGGFSIGLAFDHRRLSGVLVDLSGQQRAEIDVALHRPSPESVLPVMESAVRDLTSRHPKARARLLGVGVVAPALFEAGSLVALGPSSMPDWRGFPIQETLQKRLGCTVYLDNDATAAAVGERLYGAGRTLRDFFYIYIGVGLGGGLILSGQPYRGGNRQAGELGHLIVDPHGLPCPCGARGCLERYVSLSAAQAALTGRPEGSESVDPQSIAEAYAKSDPRLLAWLDDAARHLRTAIVGLENLLDPETIVIGGTVPDALLDDLLSRLNPLPHTLASRRVSDAVPRITKAEASLNTPALGAASLAVFDALTADYALLFKPTLATEVA